MKKYVREESDTLPGEILISAGSDSSQEMSRLHQLIGEMNRNTFNPAGLNIVWPKNTGFLFVSNKTT